MVWYFFSLQVQSCNDDCYVVMMFKPGHHVLLPFLVV